MGKTKRERKMTNVTMLGDFGTKELRQHGTVVLENAHEGRSIQVKRARRLTPIEDYHKRGLLSKDGHGDDNDSALSAGQRFFELWHRYHNVIGTPKVKCTLGPYIGGSGGSLYEGENDAKIQQEYTALTGYVGRALMPYLELVAGQGRTAEECCSLMYCNTNQFMHSLRLALEQCVKYWSY
jgi:hypothetical protein